MTITGKVSQVLTETLQDKMHPGMAILVDSKEKAGCGFTWDPCGIWSARNLTWTRDRKCRLRESAWRKKAKPG